MKSRNLLIIFIIFITFLGIAIFKKSTKKETPFKEEWSKQWVDIIDKTVSAKTINACSIIFTDNVLNLKRENEKWMAVDGSGKFLADKNKVESLFGKLDKLEGELRSNSPEVLADYNINESQAIKIRLNDKLSNIADICIGTKKAGYNKNFVRLKDSNSVYIVDTDILSEFGLWGEEVKADNFKLDLFINKTVFNNIDKEKVKEIKILSNNQTQIDLIKEIIEEKQDESKEETTPKKIKTQYKLIGDYPFDIEQSKVDSFAQSLFNLRGSSVSYEMDMKDSNIIQIKLTTEDGNEIVAECWKNEKEDKYFVKPTTMDYGFLLSSYSFKNIEKSPAEFFISNPLELKEKEISSILVNDVKNNKKYNLTKPIKDDKEQEWEQKVKSLISTLRYLRMQSMQVSEQTFNDLIVFKIMQNNTEKEYAFSTSFSLGEDKFHYIGINGVYTNCYVKESDVNKLTDLIAKLDEGNEEETTPLQ